MVQRVVKLPGFFLRKRDAYSKPTAQKGNRGLRALLNNWQPNAEAVRNQCSPNIGSLCSPSCHRILPYASNSKPPPPESGGFLRTTYHTILENGLTFLFHLSYLQFSCLRPSCFGGLGRGGGGRLFEAPAPREQTRPAGLAGAAQPAAAPAPFGKRLLTSSEDCGHNK